MSPYAKKRALTCRRTRKYYALQAGLGTLALLIAILCIAYVDAGVAIFLVPAGLYMIFTTDHFLSVWQQVK